MSRVLVCGSRNWRDLAAIKERLERLDADTTLVVGGAGGADRMAEMLGRHMDFDVELHLALWSTEGRSAGVRRNLRMLDSGVDLVIAFWDGQSRGTRHTLESARARGIPTEVITGTPS